MQGKPLLASAVVFNGAQYLIAGLSRDANAYNHHRDTLKDAMNSFHALTAAQRAAAKPYQIRLVIAQPGTSLSKLASASPLENAVAQLRLLNGLYPTGEPQPGQILKVIQ